MLPALPFIAKAAISMAWGAVSSLAAKWFKTLLTGPAFESLMLELAKEGAKSTRTTLDDKVVAEIEKAQKKRAKDEK